MKSYVAHNKTTGECELVVSEAEPTYESHGDTYTFAIGPFTARLDAQYYLDHTLYRSPSPITTDQARTMRLKETRHEH